MAISEFTLTGNISELVGDAVKGGNYQIRVYDGPKQISYTVEDEIRVPGGRWTIPTSGLISKALPHTNITGSNPETFQYEVLVTAFLSGGGKVKLDPIYVTAEVGTTTVDLADALDTNSASPTWMSAAIAQLQDYVTDGETIRDETQDIRDGIVGDLTATDSQVATLATPGSGSLLEGVLSATYGPAAQVASPELQTAFAGTRKLNFVQDGDSIAFGSGASDASFYQPHQNNITGQLRSGLDLRHVLTNVGVPGATIATRRANAAAQTDIKLDATPGVINVLSIHAGTNDLFVSGGSVAVATVEADIQGYCNERRAAGWDKIIVHTIMPRTDASTPANHEAKRLQVNTWLRANYATFADALADTGGDSIMGDVAQTTSNYFADLVHPSNRGYRQMVTYVRPLLASFGAIGSHTHDMYQQRRKLWIPASRMIKRSGTTTALTFNNLTPVWTLPDAESTLVVFSEALPDNWDYYGWDVLWCPTSNTVTAGADTVRFDLTFNSITEGSSLATGNVASGPLTSAAVASTSNQPKLLSSVNSVAVPKSRHIQIGIQRTDHATDTLTQTIHLIGMWLYKLES